MPGAATYIFSAEFDAAVARLPRNIATLVVGKIGDMGRRLDSFPHYRMTGRSEFRLRVGDYRIIYDFNVAKNELSLHHAWQPARGVSGELGPSFPPLRSRRTNDC